MERRSRPSGGTLPHAPLRGLQSQGWGVDSFLRGPGIVWSARARRPPGSSGRLHGRGSCLTRAQVVGWGTKSGAGGRGTSASFVCVHGRSGEPAAGGGGAGEKRARSGRSPGGR